MREAEHQSADRPEHDPDVIRVAPERSKAFRAATFPVWSALALAWEVAKLAKHVAKPLLPGVADRLERVETALEQAYAKLMRPGRTFVREPLAPRNEAVCGMESERAEALLEPHQEARVEPAYDRWADDWRTKVRNESDNQGHGRFHTGIGVMIALGCLLG